MRDVLVPRGRRRRPRPRRPRRAAPISYSTSAPRDGAARAAPRRSASAEPPRRPACPRSQMSTGSGAGAGQRRADRLHDPPPVGVAAVQRGLHERRVGDRARGALDRSASPPRTMTRPIRRRPRRRGRSQRELAQQRVERLAEALLVVAVGLDAHAARAAGHQDRGVVRRQLAVDARCGRRSAARRRRAAVGGLRRERRVGLRRSRASSRSAARSCPRPCMRAQAHRPGGSVDLERGALLEARRSSRSPAGSRRRRRGAARARAAGIPAATRVDGQQRRSRRSRRRPPGLRDARAQRPQRPASSRRRRARARRWRRSRCPSWRRPRAARRRWQRSRVTQHRRGGRARAVKRAALAVCSASQTSRPRSGPPLGLSPPRRRRRGSRPAARRRRRARARAPGARTQREPKNGRRAHASPSVSGRPNIRLRFWIACEDVPFQRLSIAAKHEHLAGALVACAWTRRSWSRARRARPGARRPARRTARRRRRRRRARRARLPRRRASA